MIHITLDPVNQRKTIYSMTYINICVKKTPIHCTKCMNRYQWVEGTQFIEFNTQTYVVLHLTKIPTPYT